jgi:hypothetical protein
VSRELFFDCEIKNKNPMLRHILNTMMSIAWKFDAIQT